MLDIPVRASAAQSEPCAAAIQVDDGKHAAAASWVWASRNSLARPALPQSLAWDRIFVLALVLALHVGVLLRLTVPPPAWLAASIRDSGGPAIEVHTQRDRLRVVFIEPSTPADPRGVVDDAIDAPLSPVLSSARTPPARDEPATAAAPPAMAISELPAIAPPATSEPGEAEVPPSIADAPAPVARLFLHDGAVALPSAAVAELLAMESETRVFDYMSPGLASAASAFSRRPALPYTPTRFDADWTRARTLGDATFMPIAEALTYENERKSFRCSVLPPGCSWGRVVDAVELDDPHTLSSIESAQCQWVWNAIVAATDQEEWLRMRGHFDTECRKPLEHVDVPSVPRPVGPSPG